MKLNKKMVLVGAISCSLALPSGICGAEQVQLTLAESISMALSSDESIESADAMREAASHALKAARRSKGPVFSWNAQASKIGGRNYKAANDAHDAYGNPHAADYNSVYAYPSSRMAFIGGPVTVGSYAYHNTFANSWNLTVPIYTGGQLEGQIAANRYRLNRADMDLTVNPGDDFYRYAGGGWMKTNPLKPEYSSFGVFNELAEKNRDQLKELFDNLANETHAKGSNGQKVTDLYALAMDSMRRNAEGTKPIQQDLADLASFNRATLTEFIAYQHMYLGNPFFGIGVEADLANSAVNTMYLSAGSMSLPDRDYYLKTDAESKKIQQQYRDYLTKMFMLAGYKKKDAQRATKTIYDIEYKFAEASMTQSIASSIDIFCPTSSPTFEEVLSMPNTASLDMVTVSDSEQFSTASRQVIIFVIDAGK